MDINQISASDWLDAVKQKKTEWYKENGLPVPDFTKEEDFYIVNAVENDIRTLVDKELAAANERFPRFHSQHEGHSVIREELEESEACLKKAQELFQQAWICVKINNTDMANDLIRELQECAVDLATEAVQTGAMCKKFLEMEAKNA